jgi:hypothetical protein
MKHLLFLSSFCFIYFLGPAQLAKLTASGEQQYRMNYSRGTYVNLFMKPIRSTTVEGMVPDKKGGFLKFTAIKADHGTSKQGAYVHFAKLDEKLAIRSEKEEILSAAGSKEMYPVAYFVAGNSFHLVMVGPGNSNDLLALAHWQFNLGTLALEKTDSRMTSLPFEKDKGYEFRSLALGEENLVITILEEGSKKEQSRLHCLRFDQQLALLGKQSIELPYTGKKGSTLQTEVNSNGTVFCLLGYIQKMGDDLALNSLVAFSRNGVQHGPVLHNGEPLTNCALGLSQAGQILLSGLMWPGQKDHFSGFVVSSVDDAGKSQVVQEETFSQNLISQLEHTSKKGLEKEYSVRSVSQRENGVIDVILNYCRMGGYVTGNAFVGGYSYGSTMRIADAIIFSLDKGALVSTLPIKRNLRHGNDYDGYLLSEQRFSIPAVFTRENDLYLVYFDNPDNSISAGSVKPAWSDFTKGSLVLAKIDKNQRPRQQELIRFDKNGDFRLFYELRTVGMEEGKFVLTNDRPVLLSKNVKTASILVAMNK